MAGAATVVVPARDAAATLPDLLAALEAQDLRAPFEVLVVDDGSTDATRELAAASPVVTAVLDGGGRGPAHARNVACARASGDVLAFTDADCAPAPDWLRRGLAALADADVVQGRVAPPDGVAPGPFDRTVHVGGLSHLYETANLLVRRDWFDRVGGFEPGWLMPQRSKELGEDVWLGWKLRRAGARVRFAADVRVAHAVFPRGPREFAAERLRLRFFPALVRRIPELREELCWRPGFLTRRGAELDLAVAGVAAAALTRRPALLAAALPYARTAARGALRAGRRRAPEVLAADVAADLAGLAGLAAGSVAHRSVLL